MTKQFVVIGGTSGIGAHIVDRLSEESSNQVVVGSRTAFSSELRSNVSWKQVDVCEPSPSFPEIVGELDGLVYCVGNIHLKPFQNFKDADFLNDWQVNVAGAIKAIRFYINHLNSSQNSSVVAFSTVAVTQGMNFHSSLASAKGALEGLFKSLAAEYCPKIRFNLIAPSLTDTPLAKTLINTEAKKEGASKRHPLQRIGSAKEIAALACFLLSEEGSWITGQVIHADGGLSTLKIF